MSAIQEMSYKADLKTISHSSDSKNNDMINGCVLLEALLMKSFCCAPKHGSTYFDCHACMVYFSACIVFTNWQSLLL
jgi:hypothetical protein